MKYSHAVAAAFVGGAALVSALPTSHVPTEPQVVKSVKSVGKFGKDVASTLANPYDASYGSSSTLHKRSRRKGSQKSQVVENLAGNLGIVNHLFQTAQTLTTPSIPIPGASSDPQELTAREFEHELFERTYAKRSHHKGSRKPQRTSPHRTPSHRNSPHRNSPHRNSPHRNSNHRTQPAGNTPSPVPTATTPVEGSTPTVADNLGALAGGLAAANSTTPQESATPPIPTPDTPSDPKELSARESRLHTRALRNGSQRAPRKTIPSQRTQSVRTTPGQSMTPHVVETVAGGLGIVNNILRLTPQQSITPPIPAPGTSSEPQELGARDFDDELFERRFLTDDLSARDFEETLETRDINDANELEARSFGGKGSTRLIGTAKNAIFGKNGKGGIGSMPDVDLSMLTPDVVSIDPNPGFLQRDLSEGLDARDLAEDLEARDFSDDYVDTRDFDAMLTRDFSIDELD